MLIYDRGNHKDLCSALRENYRQFMFTIVIIVHSIMPQNKLATAALSFFCQFLESYMCSVAGGVRVEAHVCKQVSLCRRLHDTSMPEAQVALHGAEGILMQDSGKISCAEKLPRSLFSTSCFSGEAVVFLSRRNSTYCLQGGCSVLQADDVDTVPWWP